MIVLASGYTGRESKQVSAPGEFHHPGLGLGLWLRFRVTVRVRVSVRVRVNVIDRVRVRDRDRVRDRGGEILRERPVVLGS